MRKKILICLGILFSIFLICGSITYAQGLYYSPYPLYYPMFNPYYFYYPTPVTRNAQVLGGTTALLLTTLLAPTTVTPVTAVPTLFPTLTPAPALVTPTLGALTIAIALAGGGGINTTTLLLLGLL